MIRRLLLVTSIMAVFALAATRDGRPLAAAARAPEGRAGRVTAVNGDVHGGSR